MTPLTKPVEITFVARPMSEAPKDRTVYVYDGDYEEWLSDSWCECEADPSRSCWTYCEKPIAWAELADMVPGVGE